MKMWKGIGNITKLSFSLNGPNENMMILPEVKYTGDKLVPHLDLQGDCFKKNHSKETSFNIVTWNVRTLGLDNLGMEMDRWELNVVGLSEVRWPGKGKIVL